MEFENLKFLVCGNVKAPQRKAGLDAGFDFFVPEYASDFVTSLESCNNMHKDNDDKRLLQPRTSIIKNEETDDYYIMVPPGCDVKIPSMVRAYIPSDQCLLLVNKSGVALKQKLIVGACLIDSSYEGIIHLHMFNAGDKPAFIQFGQKLVQAVPYYINNQEADVLYEKDISKEEFYKGHSHERGDGGFGSTGIK